MMNHHALSPLGRRASLLKLNLVLLVGLVFSPTQAKACIECECSWGSSAYGTAIQTTFLAGLSAVDFVATAHIAMAFKAFGTAAGAANGGSTTTMMSEEKVAEAVTMASFKAEEAVAISKEIVAYRPTRTTCVAAAEKLDVQAVEAKVEEKVQEDVKAQVNMLTNAPGSIAADGRVAAEAAIFKRYAENNCAAGSLPSGMTCASPRGAMMNANFSAAVAQKEQLATPADLDNARDFVTLVMLGGVTPRLDGEQLATNAGRDRFLANRSRQAAYSAVAYVLSQQVQSRRNPADLGVTVTPGADFDGPVSLQTLEENYLGEMGKDVVLGDAQGGSKQIWQTVSSMIDKNNVLLMKAFERAEQWSILRALYLAEELEETRPGMVSAAGTGR